MTDTPIRRWLTGKLPAADLGSLLAALPQRDPRVVLGPKLGEDAAVLDVGGRCLVAASDPVTFATDRVGWYAVHVNANDVAVLGAEPRWFLAVLLLPEGTHTFELARDIMADIRETCEHLDVTVCGGHTEITAGLDRPIVVGQMLGETTQSGLVRKDQLAAGDQVILTHGAAIEGTALIARDKRADLEHCVTADVLNRAEALLFEPGISVIPAVRAAVEAGGVHAMHDPTEGGIHTALSELVAATGLGLEVYQERIPVLEETRAICQCLKLDPMGLIASGALLLATDPTSTESVTAALRAQRIPSAVIAEVRPADFGAMVRNGDRRHALVPPVRDELARLFDRDAKN